MNITRFPAGVRALTGVVSLLLAAGAAHAATALGGDEKANADGSIPAWNGGLKDLQPGFARGKHHPDPFAAEKPILRIDKTNVGQHAERLSAGLEALIANYPNYYVNVYPSHRTAAFPQSVYDATKQNGGGGKCKMVGESAGVQGCAGPGFPFPEPTTGAQAIWNHKLKYKGLNAALYNIQTPVTASGAYTMVELREQFLNPYAKPGNTSDNINDIAFFFKQDVLSPARLAGQVLIVHESLNDDRTARQAWVYNPGQRRVRRAPNIAYDNPGTASDGLRTNDMYDMFNGAMNRYDWKLEGKQEMYVPYNSYKAKLARLKDLVKPNHLNPDLLRYELHRVWVVEATLKAGSRHINPRRTFFIDEDSWQILQVDHYDGTGKIWRYSEALPIQYYEVPLMWTGADIHYDLKSGRYLGMFLDNERTPRDFAGTSTPANYSPQGLRTSGVR